MIKLVGTPGCSKCMIVKKQLENKDIEFDYYLINSLPFQKQEEYKELAQQAGNLQFPIIIKDGKSIGLDEVV